MSWPQLKTRFAILKLLCIILAYGFVSPPKETVPVIRANKAKINQLSRTCQGIVIFSGVWCPEYELYWVESSSGNKISLKYYSRVVVMATRCCEALLQLIRDNTITRKINSLGNGAIIFMNEFRLGFMWKIWKPLFSHRKVERCLKVESICSKNWIIKPDDMKAEKYMYVGLLLFWMGGNAKREDSNTCWSSTEAAKISHGPALARQDKRIIFDVLPHLVWILVRLEINHFNIRLNGLVFDELWYLRLFNETFSILAW